MFRVPAGLLKKMDEIRRAQFAQGNERLGASVDGL